MVLNDEELLNVYHTLHSVFPEDIHVARSLIRMLKQCHDVAQARDLALMMARRMLASGQASRASAFLQLCRRLKHPGHEEIKALTTLVAITTDEPANQQPGSTEPRTFMLIDQLSDQEALDFFRLARLLHVEKGADIVQQGDTGSCFWIILEGGMHVHVAAPGKGRIHLGNLGPGQFFGEFSCLYHLPRSATVTANAPSMLLEFSDSALSRLMQKSPLAGEQMLRTIRTRVVQAMSRSHPAMAGIPEVDRRWLSEGSSVLEFRKGDLVGRQGHLDEGCYVIAHGSVRACVKRDSEMLCATLKSGKMFGDISPYLRLPLNAEIRANEHCLICRMPGKIFHSFMNVYGKFEEWVQRDALDRIQQWKHASDDTDR